MCYNLFMRMVRVDPTKRMFRYYEVSVQSTLLDEHAIICVWGSLKSRYQKIRILKALSPEQAQETAKKIVSRKQKKGYK